MSDLWENSQRLEFSDLIPFGSESPMAPNLASQFMSDLHNKLFLVNNIYGNNTIIQYAANRRSVVMGKVLAGNGQQANWIARLDP